MLAGLVAGDAVVMLLVAPPMCPTVECSIDAFVGCVGASDASLRAVNDLLALVVRGSQHGHRSLLDYLSVHRGFG